MGGPLWAIVAGANPASAGSAAPGLDPPLRGSYCDEQDRPPSRAGCARISGYITAGAHFEPDEPIGGRANFFAPLDEPGIAAGVPGFKTVGAPLGGETFLPRLSSGDQAR